MAVVAVAILMSRRLGTAGSAGSLHVENSSSLDPQTHSSLDGRRGAALKFVRRGAPGEEAATVVPENLVRVQKSLLERTALGEEAGLERKGARTLAVGKQQEQAQRT
jgi:hypothetical protein